MTHDASKIAGRVRAQELAALRAVPLGNALFTRESFEAEYGVPELVAGPEAIDLHGRDPAEWCIYCDGDRFVTEAYATDDPRVRVWFRWCQGCGLGHAVDAEQAIGQVANVATLPGIVEASYAMPDVHWGYGFPIGGVAATDVAAGGVVSPGGVGFDISCGVRLLASPVRRRRAGRLGSSG
jgi:hypothetical protein